MHLAESLVPARTASSSFGIPVIRVCFLPSVFELSFASFADWASTIVLTRFSFETIFFNVSSPNFGLEPKADCLVVSVSFVWLVKLGFSIIDVMNTARLSRTSPGLTLIFFLVSRYSTTWFTTWLVTASTCVPFFEVQMPFTNDIANCLSVGVSAITMFQRSLGDSATTVSHPNAFAYSVTDRHLTRSPFQVTFTSFPSVIARSHTRRSMSCFISPMFAIPNRAKSGLHSSRTHPFPLADLTTGVPIFVMLSANVCV